MMTQEEYMDVKALRAAGWTIAQTAEHVGYHPGDAPSRLKSGGHRPDATAATSSWSSTSGGSHASPGCWSATPSCRLRRS